jgi:soluble lytic murein transglycosylase
MHSTYAAAMSRAGCFLGIGLVAFVLTAILSPQASAGTLGEGEIRHYRAAFEAAEREQWGRVTAYAKHGSNALLNRALLWHTYQGNGGGAKFEEIANFLANHPGWPESTALRRRAEEALQDSTPDRVILEWFAQRPPITGWGAMRYGEALLDSGKKTEGEDALRQAWANLEFGARQEDVFLKRHGKRMRPSDHERRLDMLLWDQRLQPAKRQLKYVSAEWRLLADARMKLQTRSRLAEKALAQVPKELRENAGLLLDTVRYRRARKQDKLAREILMHAPADPVVPHLWWPEREAQIRSLLEERNYRDAYELARNHQQVAGTPLAEAEWLAGWIALRFRKDNKAAFEHFVRQHQMSKLPISLARGSYWAGRALAAAGDTQGSTGWYEKAAHYGTTFYGQLAHEQLRRGTARIFPEPPPASMADRQRIESIDMYQAIEPLAEIGAIETMRLFLRELVKSAQNTGELRLIVEAAIRTGRADISHFTAKRAGWAGANFVDASFPTLDLPEMLFERSLYFAVIRQESGFDIEATSGAGARGLMQLMPRTARDVAKRHHLPYSPQELTRNPTLNLKLGGRYLKELLSDFGGHYALALAAYNAGPGRARQWMNRFGDPRNVTDPVDWIELIPFEETRNYVMRVLENWTVYRSQIGLPASTAQLSEILRGNSI